MVAETLHSEEVEDVVTSDKQLGSSVNYNFSHLRLSIVCVAVSASITVSVAF